VIRAAASKLKNQAAAPPTSEITPIQGTGIQYVEKYTDSPQEDELTETRQGNQTGTTTRSIEDRLGRIWRKILAADEIDRDDDFFEMGGESLNAINMAAMLHNEMNLKISLTDIFANPTINKLAKHISDMKKTAHYSIQPVEEKEYYPLSPAQARIYVVQQASENKILYNLPNAALLEGTSSKMKLEETCQKLIERHESFRTSFRVAEDGILQQVHSRVDFNIEYYKAGPETGRKKRIETIIKNFIRPFDLTQPPLLRVGLIEAEESTLNAPQAKHILLADMHHIISDGHSQMIFVKEFSALYNGRQLPALNIRYRDYAQWQQAAARSGAIEKQEEYWHNTFKGKRPHLELIISRNYGTTGTGTQNYEGARLSFTADETLAQKLKEQVKETEVTLFIHLLAAFNLLLAKYSGEEDIVVGCPINGRPHIDLLQLIGMFVNILPMRNKPAENKTYLQYLREVKQNAINAYDNQDFQFEELVRKLGIKETENNPLFNVMMVYESLNPAAEAAGKTENHDTAEKQTAGTGDDTGMDQLRVQTYTLENTVSQFDLVLSVSENEDTLGMQLDYSTARFDETGMKQLMAHYFEILDQVLSGTNKKLKEIVLSHGMTRAKSADNLEEQSRFDFIDGDRKRGEQKS
ncbi:MAG: hypothetical protein GY757_00350, partial [bacterium]|nr:hypothetical protein [bacterium]